MATITKSQNIRSDTGQNFAQNIRDLAFERIIPSHNCETTYLQSAKGEIYLYCQNSAIKLKTPSSLNLEKVQLKSIDLCDSNLVFTDEEGKTYCGLTDEQRSV
jgi:hypothetical protein